MLAGVHGFVAERLPSGPRVLDACCGTGGLARRIAGTGRRVVGVDLSPKNIAYAQRRAADAGIGGDRLSFEVADVATLAVPAEGPYDVATVVLAIHEMPTAARARVLGALFTVARRVMIVDFSTPMPWNLAGLKTRMAEVAAGRTHFAAFRDYQRRGGLAPLLADVEATVESERSLDGGTLRVVVASAN